ncbi:hypothetical protein K1719_010176 [Acacia pycnantha]|nr:hypothetical protein K1719_010176 [Acacia pycnantha]
MQKKRGNTERFALYHSLDLPQDFDIVSIDQDDPDNDSDICSVIDDDLDNITTNVSSIPNFPILVISEDWNISRVLKTLTATQNICHHDFENYFEAIGQPPKCYFCDLFLNQRIRTKCKYCNIILCYSCAESKLSFTFPALPEPVRSTTDYPTLVRELINKNRDLEDQVKQLQKQLQQLKGKNKDKNPTENQGIEEVFRQRNLVIKESIPCISEPIIEDCEECEPILHYQKASSEKGTVKNNLLNCFATIYVDNEFVAVSCIIDSGDSRSCICPNAIQRHFYEEMYGQVHVTTLKTRHFVKYKLKGGTHIKFNKEMYHLPLTYVMSFALEDRTQLILGKNFLDSAGGGYLCLGNEFIILKHVDRIITSPISKNVDFQVLEEEIEELEDSSSGRDTTVSKKPGIRPSNSATTYLRGRKIHSGITPTNRPTQVLNGEECLIDYMEFLAYGMVAAFSISKDFRELPFGEALNEEIRKQQKFGTVFVKCDKFLQDARLYESLGNKYAEDYSSLSFDTVVKRSCYQVWTPKDCERLSLIQAGVLDPNPENYGGDGMFDDEYMADTY